MADRGYARHKVEFQTFFRTRKEERANAQGDQQHEKPAHEDLRDAFHAVFQPLAADGRPGRDRDAHEEDIFPRAGNELAEMIPDRIRIQ